MSFDTNFEAGAEQTAPSANPFLEADKLMVAEYLDSADAFFLNASPRKRRSEENEPPSIGFPPLDEYAAAGQEASQTERRWQETVPGQASIEVLSGKPADQSRPTVLIFDNFNLNVAPNSNREANGNLEHDGLITADAAEQRGFNVIKVTPAGSQSDLGRTMPAVAERIENGTISMGPGDVMNVTAGYGISFQDASRLFGLSITRENLKEMVPKILQRMQEVSEDSTQSADLRAHLKDMHESNRAVERIRGRGVEVVAAGGNDGADMFNLAFLTATTQLSARNATGEIASWSANNSLTTPANLHHQLCSELEHHRNRSGDSGVFFGAGEWVRDKSQPHTPDFERYVAGWAAGTSFSNVDYLWQQFDRLQRIKTGSS